MADEITPPPAAPVTTDPPAPAPPAAPPAPSTVTITMEQLQGFTAMQSRMAALEADQRTRDAESQAKVIDALAKKGETDNALAALRKQADEAIATERGKLTAIEERSKRYALDGELARVLGAQPLVPGAAAQLTKLWRSEFQVVPAGDSFVVQTPTLQSVEAFVTAQLGLAEYGHFVAARNPGGGTAGTSSTGQTVPTPTGQTAPPAGEPKNLGEAAILQMTQPGAAALDPRFDTSQRMGLGPLRQQA